MALKYQLHGEGEGGLFGIVQDDFFWGNSISKPQALTGMTASMYRIPQKKPHPGDNILGLGNSIVGCGILWAVWYLL